MERLTVRTSRWQLRAALLPAGGHRHAPGRWLERGANGVVLHLRGEVDTATVVRWDADRPAPGQDGAALGPVVAVDASAAFLDSTGLVLVQEIDAHRRPAGDPSCAPPRGRSCGWCA
jgi:hypothetical protein